MKEKSILIIEDENELLKSYQAYAKEVFTNVFTVICCNSAIEILNNENIDALLLDNKLPDGLGIDIVKKLHQQDRNIPVIMITAFADKDLAIESVNTGVLHFLEKPVSKKQIIEALNKCLNFLMEKKEHQELESFYLLTNKTIEELKNVYKLTDREIEVTSFALHNYKNNIIAKKLYISSGTVKRHLHNIFEKMEISSKEELQEIVHKLNIKLNN